MKVLVDLGCGEEKVKFKDVVSIGLDKRRTPVVDVIADLEHGLPFKDESVDYIVLKHVLEHVQNFWKLIEEIYRISKPNCLIRVWVPYFRGVHAFTNPNHKRIFTIGSFHFIDARFRKILDIKGIHVPPVDFKIQKVKLKFKVVGPRKEFLANFMNFLIDWFLNLSPTMYESIFSHFLPAEELYIELKAMK
jgi:SAM-dependent methyltransferase